MYVHLYADDVQMYVSRPLNRISECLDICRTELAKVNEWAKNNGLAINPLKSKCLIIFKKKLCNIEPSPLMINETPIKYVETANNLGITFNRTLNWNDHVNKAVGKTYGLIRSLALVKSSLPVSVRPLIAKSCIIPTVFYGLEIYANCDVASQHKLKIAYNSIARFIFNVHRSDHVIQFAYKIFDISLAII